MRLEGKVAIVTGAARGIGRAFALHLASLGADVLVADVSFAAAREYGEELSAENVAQEIAALGRRSVLFEADLKEAAAAQEMVRRCLAELGRLDILVNNAGGNITPHEASAASVVSEEDMRIQFDINFMTMVHGVQAAAPVFKEQKSGVIVNMSSAAVRYITPLGRMASYGAAKAAVAHYTKSLAMELGPYGVRVNSMAPGIIWTSRMKTLSEVRGIGRASDVGRVPLGRYGTPEDCALVLEFLVTDLSRYVTGQSISVCGGTHMMPL